MYKCKYFKIKELVNPAFLKTTSEDVLWQLFDDRLLKCADKLRDKYGPILINGGGLTDCGLRTQDTKTGASFSAHKYGRALDLHIMSIENKGLSHEAKTQAYNEIRRTLAILCVEFDVLNFEQDVYWLHIDTYNRKDRNFKG
jgi:hypothetical protein